MEVFNDSNDNVDTWKSQANNSESDLDQGNIKTAATIEKVETKRDFAFDGFPRVTSDLIRNCTALNKNTDKGADMLRFVRKLNEHGPTSFELSNVTSETESNAKLNALFVTYRPYSCN